MADEDKRRVAFWPSVTEVTEQDVSRPYRHRHDETPAGFLLDNSNAPMFPVYVFEAQAGYVGCTKTHGEPDTYHRIIPEGFRGKSIRID